ncbi:hypothetical protein HDU67_003171 [Dinochytrium kinnereticum]|nr:hypothetical protein HDU67_003171 [Dinochytrium kinnereticum]
MKGEPVDDSGSSVNPTTHPPVTVATSNHSTGYTVKKLVDEVKLLRTNQRLDKELVAKLLDQQERGEAIVKDKMDAMERCHQELLSRLRRMEEEMKALKGRLARYENAPPPDDGAFVIPLSGSMKQPRGRARASPDREALPPLRDMDDVEELPRRKWMAWSDALNRYLKAGTYGYLRRTERQHLNDLARKLFLESYSQTRLQEVHTLSGLETQFGLPSNLYDEFVKRIKREMENGTFVGLVQNDFILSPPPPPRSPTFSTPSSTVRPVNGDGRLASKHGVSGSSRQVSRGRSGSRSREGTGRPRSTHGSQSTRDETRPWRREELEQERRRSSLGLSQQDESDGPRGRRRSPVTAKRPREEDGGFEPVSKRTRSQSRGRAVKPVEKPTAPPSPMNLVSDCDEEKDERERRGRSRRRAGSVGPSRGRSASRGRTSKEIIQDSVHRFRSRNRRNSSVGSALGEGSRPPSLRESDGENQGEQSDVVFAEDPTTAAPMELRVPGKCCSLCKATSAAMWMRSKVKGLGMICQKCYVKSSKELHQHEGGSKESSSWQQFDSIERTRSRSRSRSRARF